MNFIRHIHYMCVTLLIKLAIFFLFDNVRTQECNDNENNAFDEITANQKRTHEDIINRTQLPQNCSIDARISSKKSLFHQHSHEAQTASNTQDMRRGTYHIDLSDKTFPVMIKLIAESLAGGLDYQDVYDEDSEHVNGTTTTLNNNHVEMPIPTLDGIARKVHEKEGTKLDEKQHVAYEVVCCTFLLGLI